MVQSQQDEAGSQDAEQDQPLSLTAELARIAHAAPEEGLSLGLTHYAVGEGEALELAQKLARNIADNAPLSNYVMIQALSRIEDMSKADGLFTESLCAALTQTSPHAIEGLQAFLQKRDPSFR